MTDNILVEKYKNGCNKSFDTLVKRHESSLFSYILLLTKDRQDAKDVLQEVLIKVTKAIRKNQYAEESDFFKWTLRIARNHFLDDCRKQKRHRIVERIEDNKSEVKYLKTGSSADTEINTHEARQTLDYAISQLSPELREVVILRHEEGMKFKDIAIIQGCSVNTSLGRMRYALRHLRKTITDTDSTLR